MGQAQSARRDLDAALAKAPADTELTTAVEREISDLPNIAMINPGLPADTAPTLFPTEAGSTPSKGEVLAADASLSSAAPTLRHPSHGERVAVLVVPGAARGNARNVIAHADEEIYRKLLRDIGFDVLTIGPSSRPDLDQALREAARRLPNGGEIAMFVLGTALSDANELYVMPADAPAEADLQPEGLDAAGLRLGDVLRRIQARTPRRFVVIVDECRRVGSGGPECAVETAAGTTGASIIVAHRISARAGSSQHLAQRPSTRELLTPEIVKEGQNLFRLFSSLKQRLAGSNIGLVSTSGLSTEFAFVPANYFGTLPTDCNRVAANADVNVLRTANLEPLLQACERATSTWPYAPHFSSQLAIVREQRAFQKAIASCDDRTATAGYASTYPSGRYKRKVEEFVTGCQNAQPSNQRVFYKSRVGWTLSYDGNLLYVSPETNDSYDTSRNAYETVWHSSAHGKKVAFYVQVSRNEKCRNALEYAKARVLPHRIRADRQPYSMMKREAVLFESTGFKIDGRVEENVRSVDLIVIDPVEKSTIIQIGARFPAEERDRYRPELMRILDSWTYPSIEPFAGHCR